MIVYPIFVVNKKLNDINNKSKTVNSYLYLNNFVEKQNGKTSLLMKYYLNSLGKIE